MLHYTNGIENEAFSMDLGNDSFSMALGNDSFQTTQNSPYDSTPITNDCTNKKGEIKDN
jgi:hypothetical protein